MSINLENPETVLGMVDAAANYVAQIRLALMVGDKTRAMHAVEQAERLLFNATCKIEETESANASAVLAQHQAVERLESITQNNHALSDEVAELRIENNDLRQELDQVVAGRDALRARVAELEKWESLRTACPPQV
jgi:regulator of replication initiation timing